jgi:Ca2+/Na+ antiporter
LVVKGRRKEIQSDARVVRRRLHFRSTRSTLSGTMTAVVDWLAQTGGSGVAGYFPPGVVLLVGAAILLYAVARSVLDLLNHTGATSPTPARLAIASAVPVTAVALWAAWVREAGMALGVVLGAALASLALVSGIALVNADGPADPPPGSRAFQFLLPVALVLLVLGFGARIGLTEAALLAMLGLVILGVWNEEVQRAATELGGLTDSPATIDVQVAGTVVVVDPPAPAPLPTSPEPKDRLRPVRWVLTIVLAVVGGWLAAQAGVEVGRSRRGLSPGVVGVTLLSALVMLPAVGIATFLARTKRTGIAIGAQAATALVLLTVVLPLTVAVWHLRPIISPVEVVATTLTTQPAIAPLATDAPHDVVHAMPFGVGLWRIETLLLVALALPLVPMAMGRWRPGRLEGTVLLAGYVFYLLIVVAAGDRWH